ncbi:MAG: STY0301 family protein [Rhizomicrobium sp.]
MRCFYSFLIVFLYCPAMAENHIFTCPTALEVAETAEESTLGWKIYQATLPHRLFTVSIVAADGDNIREDTEKGLGHGRVEYRWDLTTTKNVPKFVECEYSQTNLRLHRPLPPQLSTCRIQTRAVHGPDMGNTLICQ